MLVPHREITHNDPQQNTTGQGTEGPPADRLLGPGEVAGSVVDTFAVGNGGLRLDMHPPRLGKWLLPMVSGGYRLP